MILFKPALKVLGRDSRDGRAERSDRHEVDISDIIDTLQTSHGVDTMIWKLLRLALGRNEPPLCYAHISKPVKLANPS